MLELLEATCNATLVSEIDECKWNPETLSITTPHEQKDEEDMEELEMASWWNNAFDLKGIGKKNAKRAADKNPEKLFDLDADALSFATVHNRHLHPTFKANEGEEDDKSEGLAPAANPSPATPPCKNPTQKATRANEPSPARTFPPSEEEEEGDARAAGGGWSQTMPSVNPREGATSTRIVDQGTWELNWIIVIQEEHRPAPQGGGEVGTEHLCLGIGEIQ